MDKDKQMQEVLNILQEEAAEVVVAASKVMRFGIDTVHEGHTNRTRLAQEIGDVTAMIDLLVALNVGISHADVEIARKSKLSKLIKYSTIDPDLLK